MKKIFSIWENQSKTGNIYYTGRFGELEIIGFKNLKKANPKAPDVEFYLKEDKPKKDETKIYAKDIDTSSVFEEFGNEIEITDNLLDDNNYLE